MKNPNRATDSVSMTRPESRLTTKSLEVPAYRNLVSAWQVATRALVVDLGEVFAGAIANKGRDVGFIQHVDDIQAEP